MKIKHALDYKLNGERNNRPRLPLLLSDKVFVIFVYDKKGFTESKIQCLNNADLSLKWEYTHPDVINNLVATSNNGLLASCMNGEVLCFDTCDGTVNWKFITQGNIGPASNEFDSRIVFSGVQGNQSTWCIDTSNGRELWRVTNKGHSYHPFLEQDRVLNSIENDLNCLDLYSGKTIWKASEPRTWLFNPKAVNNIAITPGHGLVNFYNMDTGKLLSSIETGQSINASESSIWQIAADENAIYFGDANCFFYSYLLPDSHNGNKASLKWKIETKGGIESVPAFYQETVLVINNGQQFLSLDKITGQLKQELKTKGAAYISGVAVHDNSIFYSCYGGNVVKCNAG